MTALCCLERNDVRGGGLAAPRLRSEVLAHLCKQLQRLAPRNPSPALDPTLPLPHALQAAMQRFSIALLLVLAAATAQALPS